MLSGSRASRKWPSPSGSHVTSWRAILACYVLCVSVAWGSADLPSEVSSDRPSVSSSPETVPVGAFQMEVGLEYARASMAGGPAGRRLALQAMLRTGVTDRLEARLAGEPLVRLQEEHDTIGRGDVVLGFKYHLTDPLAEQRGPSLTALPFVKFPVAEMPIGSERTDFGVLLLAGQDLLWGVSLTLNGGLVAVGQGRPHGYLLQALAVATASRAVIGRLSTFAEVFFTSRGERDGSDAVGLDAGALYLLTRRISVDAAVGTTLSGPGPDYVLRGGFSLRLGR